MIFLCVTVLITVQQCHDLNLDAVFFDYCATMPWCPILISMIISWLQEEDDPKIDDTSAKVSDGVPTCAADYPRMDRTQPKFNPEMPVGVCVKLVSQLSSLVPLSTCSIAVGGSRRGLSYQLGIQYSTDLGLYARIDSSSKISIGMYRLILLLVAA